MRLQNPRLDFESLLLILSKAAEKNILDEQLDNLEGMRLGPRNASYALAHDGFGIVMPEMLLEEESYYNNSSYIEDSKSVSEYLTSDRVRDTDVNSIIYKKAFRILGTTIDRYDVEYYKEFIKKPKPPVKNGDYWYASYEARFLTAWLITKSVGEYFDKEANPLVEARLLKESLHREVFKDIYKTNPNLSFRTMALAALLPRSEIVNVILGVQKDDKLLLPLMNVMYCSKKDSDEIMEFYNSKFYQITLVNDVDSRKYLAIFALLNKSQELSDEFVDKIKGLESAQIDMINKIFTYMDGSKTTLKQLDAADFEKFLNAVSRCHDSGSMLDGMSKYLGQITLHQRPISSSKARNTNISLAAILKKGSSFMNVIPELLYKALSQDSYDINEIKEILKSKEKMDEIPKKVRKNIEDVKENFRNQIKSLEEQIKALEGEPKSKETYKQISALIAALGVVNASKSIYEGSISLIGGDLESKVSKGFKEGSVRCIIESQLEGVRDAKNVANAVESTVDDIYKHKTSENLGDIITDVDNYIKILAGAAQTLSKKSVKTATVIEGVRSIQAELVTTGTGTKAILDRVSMLLDALCSTPSNSSSIDVAIIVTKLNNNKEKWIAQPKFDQACQIINRLLKYSSKAYVFDKYKMDELFSDNILFGLLNDSAIIFSENSKQLDALLNFSLDNKDFSSVAFASNCKDLKKYNEFLNVREPHAVINFVKLCQAIGKDSNDALAAIDRKSPELTKEFIKTFSKLAKLGDGEYQKRLFSKLSENVTDPEIMVKLGRIADGKTRVSNKDILSILDSTDIVSEIKQKLKLHYRKNNLRRFEYNLDHVISSIEKITLRSHAKTSNLFLSERKQLLEDFVTLMSLAKDQPVLIKTEKASDKVKQFFLKDLNEEEFPKLIAQYKEILANPDATPQTKHDAELGFIAVACEAMYRTTGKFPRDTQILTLLNSINHTGNLINQVDTGEGKGIITALHASYLAVTGKTVDICTSNAELARRDLEEFEDFYKYLGIACGKKPIGPSSVKEDYIENGINHSTAASLSLYRSQMRMHHTSKVDLAKIFPDNPALVCDEIDATLTTTVAYRLAKVIDPKFSNEENMQYIYYAFSEFVVSPVFKKNVSRQADIANLKKFMNAKFEVDTKAGKQVDHLKALFATIEDSELDQFIDSALSASTLIEGTDFEVLTTNRTRPNTANQATKCYVAAPIIDTRPSIETKWSAGVQQILQARLNVERPKDGSNLSFEIEPLSQTIITTNAKNFFDYYEKKLGRVIGLTGTAGSNAEVREFYEQNHFRAYQIPRFMTNLRNDMGEMVAKDKPDQTKKLTAEIKSMVRSYNYNFFKWFSGGPQPMIIFCDDPNEVRALYAELTKDSAGLTRYGLSFQAFTDNKALDGKSEEEVVKLAGKARTITIATRAFSRGTDVDTSHTHGVYGINLCSNISDSDLKQMKGRVARNGKEGRFLSIIDVQALGVKDPKKAKAKFKEQQEKIPQTAQARRFSSQALHELVDLITKERFFKLREELVAKGGEVDEVVFGKAVSGFNKKVEDLWAENEASNDKKTSMELLEEIRVIANENLALIPADDSLKAFTIFSKEDLDEFKIRHNYVPKPVEQASRRLGVLREEDAVSHVLAPIQSLKAKDKEWGNRVKEAKGSIILKDMMQAVENSTFAKFYSSKILPFIKSKGKKAVMHDLSAKLFEAMESSKITNKSKMLLIQNLKETFESIGKLKDEVMSPPSSHADNKFSSTAIKMLEAYKKSWFVSKDRKIEVDWLIGIIKDRKDPDVILQAINIAKISVLEKDKAIDDKRYSFFHRNRTGSRFMDVLNVISNATQLFDPSKKILPDLKVLEPSATEAKPDPLEIFKESFKILHKRIATHEGNLEILHSAGLKIEDLRKKPDVKTLSLLLDDLEKLSIKRPSEKTALENVKKEALLLASDLGISVRGVRR